MSDIMCPFILVKARKHNYEDRSRYQYSTSEVYINPAKITLWRELDRSGFISEQELQYTPINPSRRFIRSGKGYSVAVYIELLIDGQVWLIEHEDCILFLKKWESLIRDGFIIDQ